jgi:hypothetical protein
MSAEIKPKYQLVHDGPYQKRVTKIQNQLAMASRRDTEIQGKLMPLIADQANLAVAFDSLAFEIKAPGPDGKTKDHYVGRQKWELIRELESTLGQFAVGDNPSLPEKLVRVPKPNGKYRELTLLNFADRVINKAMEQILSPYWDRFLLPYSFGSRSGLSIQHAWACAASCIDKHGPTASLLAADIQSAFDSVPTKQLLDILPKYQVPQGVIDLISWRIQRPQGAKGLRQGDPLSPLLINLYLHHLLDWKFRQQYPDVNLLRYIDDLLLIGPNAEATLAAFQAMTKLIGSAGLKINHEKIQNNRATVEWLGAQLASNPTDGKIIRVDAEQCQTELLAKLYQCRIEDAHPSYIASLLAGTISHLGPLSAKEFAQFWHTVSALCKKLGFDLNEPKYYIELHYTAQQRLLLLTTLSPTWLAGHSNGHLDQIRRGQAVCQQFKKTTIYIAQATTNTGTAWAGCLLRNNQQKRMCGNLNIPTHRAGCLIKGLLNMLDAINGRVTVRVITDNQSFLNQISSLQESFKRFGMNQGWIIRARPHRLTLSWHKLADYLPRLNIQFQFKSMEDRILRKCRKQAIKLANCGQGGRTDSQAIKIATATQLSDC